MISRILVSLLAGIIVGPLARLLLPGKQNITPVMTVVLGGLGALVGWAIASWGKFADTKGPDVLQTVLSIVLAMVFVAGYGMLKGNAK
ncbi:MAG: GlsB/YeaQ/YmgE family stress response membrane protein [Dermatophilaceae bacterium]